ncbi:MAG: restriction endonuclease subunit S [Prevotella sp.]|nr:restriction endonuclease subunit S [Prevotella sp.]
MKHGWDYKKLGELVQVLNGYAFKSSLYENQGIRVLRITNVQKGNIVDDDPKYYPLSLTDEIRNYLLKENDLLMSLTGNVGRVGLLTKEMLPAALNQRVACLRILSNGLNLGFLFHYLNSDKFEQDAVLSAKGIAQKNMSTEWLKDYKLPLPPISVQQTIVSELDKINELIRLKKEQLKDYDNLAQSIFYEMFGDPVINEKGWEFMKIGEIGTVERGAGISKKDFVEDGLPCIHYGQLHTILGPTTRHHHSCIPESLLPKYKIAHTNDVIMAITSEDVEGSCKSTAWLGNYDIVIGSDAAILHHEQDGTFLSYYTMTKAFFNEKSKYAKGFKVTHISAKEIENIPVYLPPLALQKDFAKRIEVIEQQKENIKSTIQDLETLLASRMQYWFD